MNVEEMLRQTMVDRADDVAGSPTIGRAGRAREQARSMRRRQYAATAVAALAVTAAGIGASGLLGGNPPPEPAPEPTRVIDVAPSFAGRTLITSGETHDGEPLFLTVDAPSGSEWMVTCAGLGPEYVVHRAVDDQFEETAPCGPLEVLGESMSFRWSSAEPVGNDVELAVWITLGGEAVQPEGAILAAAVYEMPPAVTMLAGTDVAPLEVSLGQEWAYLDSVESEPGERRLTVTFPAFDEEVLLELVTDPVGASADVELLVDGVATASPRTFPLGGSSTGDRLNALEAHTVTLRIVGDVPPDARLGIVRRRLADGQ
ncbi:hypothetical protein J2X46_001276 [Nocardioides sp. BE266]|uniref:hypothetical protein n=1 Tax=Nocardioides sp. BE266 TaxID=2817725 RepID=UPI00285B52E8|nr:hypothetical protein [Nocardioides sp. BE266]MDR7252300.1 hypothetical protein [Nocardioides sp. BE266]